MMQDAATRGFYDRRCELDARSTEIDPYYCFLIVTLPLFVVSFNVASPLPIVPLILFTEPGRTSSVMILIGSSEIKCPKPYEAEIRQDDSFGIDRRIEPFDVLNPYVPPLRIDPL